MRLLVQRALRGSVTVGGQQISAIGRGIVALVGIRTNDEQADTDWIIRRLLTLKLWPDESGRPWSKNVVEMGYEILCVSQFTLHAVFKGAKPDFHHSMAADRSKAFYDAFLAQLRKEYRPDRVFPGEFGSMMEVALVNDGPVTFMLDSKKGDGAEESPTVPAALGAEGKKAGNKQQGGKKEKNAAQPAAAAPSAPESDEKKQHGVESAAPPATQP